MVLRQLEYLAALAREKHFGRAAEACHVSQPTLSAAIRLLEDDLGAPIVERGHRYVGLTPQGQVALDHAHRVLAELENLRHELDEIDKGLTGRLRHRGDSDRAADRFPAHRSVLPALSWRDGRRLFHEQSGNRSRDRGFRTRCGPHLSRRRTDQPRQDEADLCRGISLPDAGGRRRSPADRRSPGAKPPKRRSAC